MPRRAVRCLVDLNLSAVSAPGCWLPSKEECYLSVSLFSQFKNTQLLGSTFPILVNESFKFEKTYFTSLEVEDVSDLLQDELVVIELLQLSEYSDGAVHLATYTNNVREFLYPYETNKTTFVSRDRDIFLERTIAFPGISPKLEFSSRVALKESYSEELDALEDAIDYHKSTVKDIRRSKRRPRSLSPKRRNRKSNKITSTTITWKTRRSTSPTLSQRIEDIDLYAYADNRPPFVVRKLDTDLIGRQPGGLLAANAKSKPHKCIRVNTHRNKIATECCPLCYDEYTIKCCSICKAYKRHLGRLYWGHSKDHHPTGHVCLVSQRQKFSSCITSQIPRYSSGRKYLDSDDSDLDDDSEVAGYTSRIRPSRARSVSPGLRRPRSGSPRSRLRAGPGLSSVPLGDRSSRRDYISPSLRTKSPFRSGLDDPPLSYYGRDAVERSHRYRYPTHDTLDDLAMDTSLAKYRSQVHIDNGHYWTERAARLSGKSHGLLFNDNISKMYNRLYKHSRNLTR